jgi:hypothetical protein
MANSWNSSLFETGSVSQPMPTIEPIRPSTMWPTRPSVVSRPARLLAEEGKDVDGASPQDLVGG